MHAGIIRISALLTLMAAVPFLPAAAHGDEPQSPQDAAIEEAHRLAAAGQGREAIRRLQQAQQGRPTAALAYELASLYRNMAEGIEDYQHAESGYQAVIDLEPDSERSHQARRRLEEIQGCLRTAKQVEALMSESRRLFDSGFPAKAIAAQRDVVRMCPLPWIVFNLGRLYEQAGDQENARRCFEQALADEPDPKTRQLATEKIRTFGAAAGSAGVATQGSGQPQAAQTKPQNAPPATGTTPPLTTVSKAPAAARHLAAWGWVSSGLGGALLAAAVGCNVGAFLKRDEIRRIDTDWQQSRINRKYNAIAAEVDRRMISAGVLYGMGGAALVTGVVLLVLDTRKPPTKPTAIPFSLDVGPQHVAVTVAF